MTHLGSWISALADGQLAPAAAERALAHVACCPQCAADLSAARAARRAVSLADDVPPAPDLTARLLALGTLPAPPVAVEPSSLPRGSRLSFASHLAPRHPFPAGGMTGDVTRGGGAGVRWAIGSLAGAGVVAAGLFALGGVPSVAPAEHTAQSLNLLAEAGGAAADDLTGARSLFASVRDRTALVSTASSDVSVPEVGGDVSSVLTWMAANGWSAPPQLPEGTTVTALRLRATGIEVLEVDLGTPHGQVVLTEQRGRLDVAAMAGVDQATFGARRVFVLSRAPLHLAWQSHDDVVQIVSDASVDQVDLVVRGFPADGYDDTAPARISRGWRTLTGALSTP